MGNNHEKYFNQNQRKVIILGPSTSGKTTLYRLINGCEKDEVMSLYIPTDKFSNSQLKLMKKIEIDLWDLGGKLPHLWGHYFSGGVQGIVYVVENMNF